LKPEIQMNNEQAKELCLNLIRADSEEAVISLLRQVGFWDDLRHWRLYDDNENNFSAIGNQKARPEDALVEKLINSVDARLIDECRRRGIDPECDDAPQSIREAVARYFDGEEAAASSTAGLLRNWSKSKRTDIAEGITLAATGSAPGQGNRNPCFTISDRGEGQTPEGMPGTLLSLTRSYKIRIIFVQGKFHMGGTGVLKFCGKHNLQLIVTRRDPAVLGERPLESDTQWGFTVVRRIVPEGAVRSSVYMYLAPLTEGRSPGKGGVPRFSADSLPIFPEGRNAYARESPHGTLIKLYEYEATGCKSNILMRDGLLRRVEVLLPEVALPIRFHECRPSYKGHEGSFDNTLTGIVIRLEDDKSNALEFSPSTCPINVAGEHMSATLYAFKRGKADTYRKDEGIVFTRNGQTHAHLTKDFFRRKQVGLSYMADSLLVMVDCSNLSVVAGEDLFLNSRDRLSKGPLRTEIDNAIADWLRHHQGLRELSERRRREETDEQLKDSKPLEDILRRVLRVSPILSRLFLAGERITNPFRTTSVTSEAAPFDGKAHPTFFKFKDKPYGTVLKRDCHINLRCRITFETDVVDDYFGRPAHQGEFRLYIQHGDVRHAVEDYVGPNLQNGIATLSVRLPANCQVGDQLDFVASVDDSTLLDPFENCFTVTVKGAAEVRSGTGKKGNPPSEKPGGEHEVATGIQLPEITRVYATSENGRKTWGDLSPAFDKNSALRVKRRPPGEGGAPSEVYDFFINMDNLYLQSELKVSTKDAEVTATRFEIGMVLLGLALLQGSKNGQGHQADDINGDQEGEEEDVEETVEQTTRVIAPILLPMIQSLGALDLTGSGGDDYSGEAT
jgi:hypothetical protein